MKSIIVLVVRDAYSAQKAGLEIAQSYLEPAVTQTRVSTDCLSFEFIELTCSGLPWGEWTSGLNSADFESLYRNVEGYAGRDRDPCVSVEG